MNYFNNHNIKDLIEENQKNLLIKIIGIQKEPIIIENNKNNNINDINNFLKKENINIISLNPIKNDKEKLSNNINNLKIEKLFYIKLSYNNNIINNFKIVNNGNIIIKQKKKKRKDKMTEITEELNPLIPINNIEFNIDKIIKKIKYINNKEQEIYFIKDMNNNEIKYTNILLEINKGDALEINPFSIKKTEIKKENNFDILNNKYIFYSLKAKNKMMKMILPIKIKIVLKKYLFRFIIKYLKENKTLNKDH